MLLLLPPYISNVNAPCLHQRPIVRGHAEACPSTTYAKCPVPRSLSPLGGREFFFQQNLCRWGRGPGRLLTGIHTMQNLSQFSDLRIQPVGFAQIWHRASLKDYKNFFLVAFFDWNILCWPKLRLKCPLLRFYCLFRIWRSITFFEVLGAGRTWRAILLSTKRGVREQNFVQIGWKLDE